MDLPSPIKAVAINQSNLYVAVGHATACYYLQGVFHVSPLWPARVTYRALLRTAREVAQGMTHLHARGVIHADLKPANVMLKSSRVDRRGFVAQVTDFGLSRCGFFLVAILLIYNILNK